MSEDACVIHRIIGDTILSQFSRSTKNFKTVQYLEKDNINEITRISTVKQINSKETLLRGSKN